MKKNKMYYAIMCKLAPDGAVFDERLHIYPKKKDADKALKKMSIGALENFYGVFKVQVEVKIIEEGE